MTFECINPAHNVNSMMNDSKHQFLCQKQPDKKYLTSNISSARVLCTIHNEPISSVTFNINLYRTGQTDEAIIKLDDSALKISIKTGTTHCEQNFIRLNVLTKNIQ